MRACNYLLKNNDRLLNAKEYGYWSLRWACPNADQAFNKLHSDPFKSMPIVVQGRAAPFLINLQLIALHAACYWVYAATLPHLAGTISTDSYTETLRLLKCGLEDGVKDLRHGDQPYSNELVALFMNSFKMFHDSIPSDIVGARIKDKGIINVTLSQTATRFILGTARLYKIDPKELDVASELTLAGFVDDIFLDLILSMKDLVSIQP